MKKLDLPLTKKMRRGLKAGDRVFLTGLKYTARDAAHRRLCESIDRRKRLPIRLKDNIIYYCGPTPAIPGNVIGSCGPTTSKRMDRFTPLLLRHGLSAMIGKGDRQDDVRGLIKRYAAIYFIAPAGAGAYISLRVKRSEVIAYKDLGPEAIYRLYVEDLPVIVAIDARGNDIYQR